MKKVLFICLLTLSVCLSRPNDTPPAAAPSPNPQQKAEAPPANPTHASETTPTAVTPTNKPAPVPEKADKGKGTATDKQTDKPKTDEHAKADNETPKPKDPANSTDKDKPAPPKPNSDVPTPPKGKDVTPSSTPAAVPDKDKTTVKPSNGTETTTPAKKTEETTKASVAPSTAKPDEKVPVLARGFDGSSFFGGIILTLGLLAIGFMGYKYYKNQTERNYHTL